jgi:hypothetical protein
MRWPPRRSCFATGPSSTHPDRYRTARAGSTTASGAGPTPLPGQMPGGQRERATAGLARQCEPVQAEMTGQQPAARPDTGVKR